MRFISVESERRPFNELSQRHLQEDIKLDPTRSNATFIDCYGLAHTLSIVFDAPPQHKAPPDIFVQAGHFDCDSKAHTLCNSHMYSSVTMGFQRRSSSKGEVKCER